MMSNIYYFDISGLNEDSVKNDISLDRYNYLLSINDEFRRRQSYFASKLLEYALKKNGVDYSKGFIQKNGEWRLKDNEIKFSISHSKNIVCVAISMDSIGVDVECVCDKLLKLQKKVNLDENASISQKMLRCASFWTEKEAVFKAKNNLRLLHNYLKDKQNNLYDLCVATNEDVKLIKIEKL